MGIEVRVRLGGPETAEPREVLGLLSVKGSRSLMLSLCSISSPKHTEHLAFEGLRSKDVMRVKWSFRNRVKQCAYKQVHFL